MSKLYASPLRVYICLAVIALAGVFSGLRLPVSLFPNSSKPHVIVEMNYGDSTADEFLNSYGNQLEGQLRSISTDAIEVEKISSSYDAHGVEFEVFFKWGAPPKAALREVESIVNSFGGRLPKEVRDSVNIQTRSGNSGFLAISYYSPTRSLDNLFDLLEPVIVPRLSKVQDASNPGLWNPTKKEIRVELKPDTMASLQLFPRDIERAISTVLAGYSGGSVTIGTQQLVVQMPRSVNALDDLGSALVTTPSGQVVHLSDVARIDLGPQMNDSRSFKTSGTPSLILFAQPRPGGNVKRMSEEIIDIVRDVQLTLPKDVEYKILVDPSEFIRASVQNVFHEVVIGALLAVVVLFLFIGSFRNTITAAIEIPLSMVLAFILMRLSGMNLNLISLGGLALSAGMNVDASVVVMENIFRHFHEHNGPALDRAGRLALIVQAVSEVRFAVIASTIASLVVFLPLAFTSDLSYAILGDLAKTVVFSHGFSAIVALVLVPTVRLHLMSRAGAAGSVEKPMHSPIEGTIAWLENFYVHSLEKFMGSRKLKRLTYFGLAGLLALLATVVLPTLPREIIGRPDTDWMILGVNTRGNTLLRQMESTAEEVEAQMLAKYGDKIQYTFNQIQGPNDAYIMGRLKNKKDMKLVWKGLEAQFANTPVAQYWVAPWNPAELPIPDPPQLRVVIRGGELADRAHTAQAINDLLEENKAFPRLSTVPNANRRETIFLKPNVDQWSALAGQGIRFLPSDLADLARVATDGRRAGQLSLNSHLTDIMLRYPEGTVRTVEDLGALPVGVGAKIIPLKALARVGTEEVAPTIYREDQRELFLVTGRENEDTKSHATVARQKSLALIEKWRGEHPTPAGISIFYEDAEKDLHEALQQLALAVALSILLIFVTLVIQFGDVVNSLLVLVAVPLGFIGVLLSLFVFRSTLSLNSVLGVILLNGIAVANSIILVDFLKRLVEQGRTPREAALEAARKRLRPILITSLTTVLGMLPIALGMGEGGKILQPLGIAVSGGLWFSMGLTLFIVPALQVAYLEYRGSVVAEAPAFEQNQYLRNAVARFRSRNRRPVAALLHTKRAETPRPPEYLQ